MKAAIIYASVHHENTKKVVEAIAGENVVDLIDATKEKERDLSGYDLIGFASGVYYGKIHQTVLNFASVNLPANKNVFLLCTCGGSAAFRSIEEVVKSKQGKIVGKFSCKGYDTFGPFKLVGGIAKGHPDDKDLADAVAFYKGIIRRFDTVIGQRRENCYFANYEQLIQFAKSEVIELTYWLKNQCNIGFA